MKNINFDIEINFSFFFFLLRNTTLCFRVMNIISCINIYIVALMEIKLKLRKMYQYIWTLMNQIIFLSVTFLYLYTHTQFSNIAYISVSYFKFIYLFIYFHPSNPFTMETIRLFSGLWIYFSFVCSSFCFLDSI